jgi:hypothetical protein
MSLKRKRITRTAEVTVETEESFVFRRSSGQHAQTAYCPVCRRQVGMLSPEHAARVAGVSTRAIYVWVESGAIHFTEAHGRVAICAHSLSQRGTAIAAEAPGTVGNSQRRET